jgi:hypothetical protein
MSIACERLVKSMPSHCDEGNAVGKRPFFVGPSSVHEQSIFKKALCQRKQNESGIGLENIPETQKRRAPERGSGHAIGEFRSNPRRGDNLAVKSTGEFERLTMRFVAVIKQAKKKNESAKTRLISWTRRASNGRDFGPYRAEDRWRFQ